MKRLIIITIILFIAVIAITVAYFKNLSPTGMRTGEIMRSIPDNAPLVFEFNNDDSFYDIFKNDRLFAPLIGKQQLEDLTILRYELLNAPSIKQFFNGQNIFISLHPSNNKTIDLLLTVAATKNFDPAMLDELAKRSNKELVITSAGSDNKKEYTIYSKRIKKRFYLVSKENNIYAGSFSKDLIDQYKKYVPQQEKQSFVLLPDQQNANSLASIYINYAQLNPLFEQLFTNRSTDIFKSFRLLPALGALSLNFKSDALMFSGFSSIQTREAPAYLNLFADQQPVVNHIKDIFPSTTAYSICFAVSDAERFKAELAKWQTRGGMQVERDSLLNRVKFETGINLMNEVYRELNTEFAIVTTRYMEKLAIISLKDGSKLLPVLYNISHMKTDNMGQFNYNKLPFYLLGDAFGLFNHPWFMIIDNYLVLANSELELNSYYDSYINRKFQSKLQQYNEFDDLIAEKSNVSWYINFKNASPILKRDMNDEFYNTFENNKPGWKDYYAASYQLTAANKVFYTAFCMKLNPADSTDFTK